NETSVEAGKQAATELRQLQAKVRANLNKSPRTADDIARALGADPESVYHVLVHLRANDPLVQSAQEEEVAADKFFRARNTKKNQPQAQQIRIFGGKI